MIAMASVSPVRVGVTTAVTVLFPLNGEALTNAQVADLEWLSIRHLLGDDGSVATSVRSLKAKQAGESSRRDVNRLAQSLLRNVARQMSAENALKTFPVPPPCGLSSRLRITQITKVDIVETCALERFRQ